MGSFKISTKKGLSTIKNLLFFVSLLFLFSCKEDQTKTKEIFQLHYQDSVTVLVDSLYKAYRKGDISATKTMQLYDSLETENIKLFQKRNQLSSHILHSKGKVHYKIRDYESSKNSFWEALKIKEEILPENHPEIARSYQNLGVINYILKNYFTGLNYSLQAALYPDELDSKLKKDIYKTISLLYKYIGDYDQAIYYLENAIAVAAAEMNTQEEKARMEWTKIWAYLNNDMTGLYAANMKDPVSAFPYAKRSYEKSKLNLNTEADSSSYSKVLNNMGIVYELNDELDSALYFYNHALQINLLHQNANSIGANLDNMSIVFKKMQKWDEALDYCKRSLEYHSLHNKLKKNYVYDNMAEVYLNKGDIDLALYYLNLAMKFVVTDFKPETVVSNPVLLTENLVDKPGLFIYLGTKADALAKKYEKNNKQIYLEAAYEAYLKMDSLIDIMRPDYPFFEEHSSFHSSFF